MATLVPLFLIESSSVLRVRKTRIKASMSLNFHKIQQLSTKLAVLESLKNQCLHIFSVVIDPILFKLADKEEMNNILDEFDFLPNWNINNRVTCP